MRVGDRRGSTRTRMGGRRRAMLRWRDTRCSLRDKRRKDDLNLRTRLERRRRGDERRPDPERRRRRFPPSNCASVSVILFGRRARGTLLHQVRVAGQGRGHDKCRVRTGRRVRLQILVPETVRFLGHESSNLVHQSIRLGELRQNIGRTDAALAQKIRALAGHDCKELVLLAIGLGVLALGQEEAQVAARGKIDGARVHL